MKSARIIAGVSLALFVGLVLWFDRSAPTPSTGHLVRFSDAGFSPAELVVRKGDTVTFENGSSNFFWPASNLHPTHLLYSEFDPTEPIPPGKSWQFRFAVEGSWKYHDHLAPYFTGTVTVRSVSN